MRFRNGLLELNKILQLFLDNNAYSYVSYHLCITSFLRNILMRSDHQKFIL